MYGAAISFPACNLIAFLRSNATSASVALEKSQSYDLPTHESTWLPMKSIYFGFKSKNIC